ncbi:MAG: BatA domain-containing protein, partial [Planctomycetota bacterium]
MEFWNGILLVGLGAVAIPIIIHLLNRRRAKVIDWGAMRFLLGSVAARNRRIMIEEIILMILRCLLVALAALAVARPFLRRESAIPWPAVFPAALAAVICVAIAGASWHYRKARWYLLAAAAGLLMFAGGASAADYFLESRLLPTGSGGTDFAVIMDGSVSTYLRHGGRSNFERIAGGATEVVKACKQSDAMSLIIAGPVPHQLTRGAISDKKRLHELLRKAKPTGGSMHVTRALETAANVLSEGKNPTKRFVLITDTQDIGWDTQSPESWSSLAASLKKTCPKIPPEIICHRLELPTTVTNATIESVKFSHKVIGVGRTVSIHVTVRNFGTEPLPPSTLALHIEGADKPLKEELKDIPRAASRSVTFEHIFEKPGPHVVSARLLANDDIVEDNAVMRVVDVTESLPVLIVDGAPSAVLEDSASACLSVALSAREDVLTSKGTKRPDTRKKGAEKDKVKSVIEPLVILPENLPREKNLKNYRAIILANVPRLPATSANALADYVSEGGGLLIVAGDRASPEFYNNWTSTSGRRVAPAKLPEKRTITADPVP